MKHSQSNLGDRVTSQDYHKYHERSNSPNPHNSLKPTMSNTSVKSGSRVSFKDQMEGKSINERSSFVMRAKEQSPTIINEIQSIDERSIVMDPYEEQVQLELERNQRDPSREPSFRSMRTTNPQTMMLPSSSKNYSQMQEEMILEELMANHQVAEMHEDMMSINPSTMARISRNSAKNSQSHSAITPSSPPEQYPSHNQREREPASQHATEAEVAEFSSRQPKPSPAPSHFSHHSRQSAHPSVKSSQKIVTQRENLNQNQGQNIASENDDTEIVEEIEYVVEYVDRTDEEGEEIHETYITNHDRSQISDVPELRNPVGSKSAKPSYDMVSIRSHVQDREMRQSSATLSKIESTDPYPDESEFDENEIRTKA